MRALLAAAMLCLCAAAAHAESGIASVRGAELRQRILQTISDLGFDQSNRGDDAYYVFRK